MLQGISWTFVCAVASPAAIPVAAKTAENVAVCVLSAFADALGT